MGRSGFNGVPGPPGEKGQSISPPNELKFKVSYYRFFLPSLDIGTNKQKYTLMFSYLVVVSVYITGRRG